MNIRIPYSTYKPRPLAFGIALAIILPLALASLNLYINNSRSSELIKNTSSKWIHNSPAKNESHLEATPDASNIDSTKSSTNNDSSNKTQPSALSSAVDKTTPRPISNPPAATVGTATISPPVVVPAVPHSFGLTINPADVIVQETGEYYFTFYVVRSGGFTDTINLNSVDVSPQGSWPNYIEFIGMSMLSENKGYFILKPHMSHPKDVTITLHASAWSAVNGLLTAQAGFQFYFL